MAASLQQFLDPQAICLRVEAASSEDVIRLLAERLLSLGFVKPGYADAVIAREATLPTGLPTGGAFSVAVPHTDPEHVLRPAVAIATLITPVPFASMDDPEQFLDVRLVFMLALNDKNHQIEILQRVAQILQHPAQLAAIAEAPDAAAVIAAINGKIE